MYGCMRALSQRDISRTSRPTTWFNSHAFLLYSLSLSLLLIPFDPNLFFVFPLSPSVHLPPSLSRSPSSSVLSLLSWHRYEGQTRTSEICTKPWPTKGESSVGSLAILTSPRSPNARILDCSQLLLLLVTSLKQNEKLLFLLSSLSFLYEQICI